jgi:hypothetical protein
MVLRHDAAGVLAVGQPAHAVLCGQFARAWGNAHFDAVAPLDEVTLGAEQHDVGWAEWDLSPEFNPATGLPRGFTEVDLSTSTALWRHGPSRLESQGRYAALLATLHGRRLYGRIDLARRPTSDAEAVRALLAESDGRARRLTATLRADPDTAAAASGERLAVNSALVWTWDTLSLALLLGWAPHTLRAVPTTRGSAVDVQLDDVASRDGLPTLSLSPWPFADPHRVVVHTEGRRLAGRYAGPAELQDALRDAPWETARFVLCPATAVAPAPPKARSAYAPASPAHGA